MSFKDQLKQDLSVFFSEEEFAQRALLQNGLEILVFFDEKEAVVFDTGLESDVSASALSVTCRAEDVDGLHYGDSLTLDGVTYYIIDMEPPQSGVRKIYISEDRA